ncbi:hypothetical protein CkaCkLH20_03081 [Colletotrichum karsti]|uniref:Uncharacterized protein n=1 Tax=Colletotrichum karsti TaxID=1095194 RepID=A0A9P6LN57_9PEZI|nr:uncharacterized protein CkaCkLH20_03081 [Colletotrichum karsti]KAF9879538.1 hypothetical protein CkaCkLH20_03081 [Colletotrichum karsti]
MSSVSSGNSSYGDAPPGYKESLGANPSGTFISPSDSGTISQLDIQAIGYDTNQALTGNTLENIPVYRVGSGELEYTSIRLKKNSNSCALVRGSDTTQTPVISTIYRWGPGRRPRMRILPPGTAATVEEAINSDHLVCEVVEVKSRNMMSRTQELKTSFGTFEWRYGGRGERKEASEASSLLVLERTDDAAAAASASGKTGKHGVPIAQLVRSAELRTAGTSRWMGGNGGRLIMDLGMWTDDKKTAVKDAEAFIVASCLLMLKREADRFKDNTIAAVV